MDSFDPVISGTDSPVPASLGGELIVQNGRQVGATKSLNSPVTLIGRAPGCDIRLNLESIHPLHCALLPSPTGLILRDLGSDSGTLVNDKRVSSCVLRDGDILGIGPFRLLVRWPQQCVEMVAEAPEPGEVDALRVQAAAVAAQQAGLLEEENRLQQRRVALERQEQQLAAHLEEKRQQLVELRDEVKSERHKLKQQRAGLEQERQNLLGEAERDRAEAALTLEKARRDRLRVSTLRRRLRKRWKDHWKAKEAEVLARERQVETRTREFDRERQRLDALKNEITQGRLRLNGDRELNRCEQREEWQKLRQAQLDWQAEREKMATAQAAQQVRLDERARAVQTLEQQLTAKRQQAQTVRDELVRETQGLETRVRNLREAVAALHTTTGMSSTAVPAVRVMTTDESARMMARLEAVAVDLADQRLALVEQWEHFHLTQQQWTQSHVELLPKLDDAARHLDEREQQLDEREQSLQAETDSLAQRKASLAQLRGELEAWQTRLTLGEMAWQTEREALTARSKRIEELARRRLSRLDVVRKQWASRRRDETVRLGRELQRCRELQRLYTTLREDLDRRMSTLGGEQRSLAERTFAIEQLELERVGRAEDAGAMERRLQKIRKQINAQHAEAEHRLTERGRHLEEEAHRLSVQAHNLHQRMEVAGETETTLSARQTEWEHRLIAGEQAREQLEEEVEQLRQQEQLVSRRCKDLQEELERLINALLQDAEPLSRPMAA
jgi:hypothetical protein